ncbi:hypothetical protein EYF80_010390 [Liparis tanakae]|uniref:Uncharacterized protein n=1 Tax=Liparis tanakae TaxID=230148 RepID=A0A4Z2INC7_9TELE|nr:hypothetical protein EYF80_010390 [Liparis tanakae]
MCWVESGGGAAQQQCGPLLGPRPARPRSQELVCPLMAHLLIGVESQCYISNTVHNNGRRRSWHRLKEQSAAEKKKMLQEENDKGGG